MSEEEKIEDKSNDSDSQFTENELVNSESSKVNEENEIPKSEIPKSELPNMEVHHHGHVHHQKKWKEYLFQFVMLFLAVALGFFTENRREHYVESLREKEYMHSMIADLVEDTTQINESIHRNNNRITGLDSLVEELNKPVYNTKLLYYYRRKYTSAFDEAIFSQRTLSQLKNSGNMRLIHSQEVSDRINDYDLSVNNIDKRANLSQQYLNYSRDLDWSIFDSYQTFRLKINTIKMSDIILQTPGEMHLLSDNRSLIKKYSNILISWRGLIESYVFMIGVKKEKAISLIAFLKNEYGFK